MASKTMALDIPKQEAAKIDAAIRECVTEMEHARKRMKQDQAEIDRLKAQTRALLSGMKAA